ncbi:hypothetical protein V1387_04830 [Allomuricauda taeanensis]|uniref:AbiJ-NTD4 domain-containing protein n=1 Tax=Flagellimonas taeanensis TaxID=1005926 RepID=UPI002E7BB139|nr:hypothetical protein [Allomuricauda taeanensis]MEE1962000.1 hypothetical protein [Allomuricauda taeanensis]
MGFSERYGHATPRESLQLNSIHEKLRIKIWNCIDLNFISTLNSRFKDYNSNHESICRVIWTEFLERDIDAMHPFKVRLGVSFFQDVRSIYNKMEWFEVYEFIENLSILDQIEFDGHFTKDINIALEAEHSGYRLVNNQVLKITDKGEIESIEEAIESNKESPASTHLKAAINLLSIKNPDYRNSIKESISAVESACSILVDKPKATLGDALNILEREYNLHPALKKSFNSLYGYTSDAGGIRHKMKQGDEEPEHGDAIFMLVSASAFINYLQFKFKK